MSTQLHDLLHGVKIIKCTRYCTFKQVGQDDETPMCNYCRNVFKQIDAPDAISEIVFKQKQRSTTLIKCGRPPAHISKWREFHNWTPMRTPSGEYVLARKVGRPGYEQVGRMYIAACFLWPVVVIALVILNAALSR